MEKKYKNCSQKRKGTKPMIKYKESEISWIGQVPENWEVKSISHLVKERIEKNDKLQEKTMLFFISKQ